MHYERYLDGSLQRFLLLLLPSDEVVKNKKSPVEFVLSTRIANESSFGKLEKFSSTNLLAVSSVYHCPATKVLIENKITK